MNKISIYKVDAFTNKLFTGNPAAVCPLKKWLPDNVMQSIALENNLSETAFFVLEDDEVLIRWFTPKVEIELCGHATLASAHIIFNELKYRKEKLIFNTFFGEKITVFKENDFFSMDFPSYEPEQSDIDLETIKNILNANPIDFLTGIYGLAIFNTHEEINAISPNFELLKKLPYKGIIVTAPGKDSDFVSRFFGPNVGIKEDPVTGSAHCLLIPYWYKQLKKNQMIAHQLSSRGGELFCSYHKDRVRIGGNAITFLKGEITLT
jgi:PhzF family phenazine biosynthesis protein